MNHKVFTSEVSSTQLWNGALVYRLLVWFLVVLFLGLMAGCGQTPIEDKPPKSELLLAVQKLETKFECGREEQHEVITKGLLDMFSVAVDPSTTTTLPDSNLDTWFNSVILGTNNYQGQQTLAGYDGQFVNQFFGDTFSGLPSNITKAFFITGVRGIGEIQNNDGLTIGKVGTPLLNDTIGGPINNLGSPWNTSTLTNNELLIAIAINPSSVTSGVLDSLNTHHELDVVVQDDTSVDFTRLHVCYEKKGRFDLSIEKSLEGNTLTIGSQSTYNIQVTNNGPSAANTTITVTDTLPLGISWDGNSPPNWNCTLQNSNPDVVECIYTGPPIPPNGPNNFVTLSLTVEVTADVGKVARNCAQVSATGDTVDSNNESCIKNPVQFVLDISTGSLNDTTALAVGDFDNEWRITSSPPINSNAYVGDSIVTLSRGTSSTMPLGVIWAASHSAHSRWIMPYDLVNPPNFNPLPGNSHVFSWVTDPGDYVYERNFSTPLGCDCYIDVTRHASDNGSQLSLYDNNGLVDLIGPSLPGNANSFHVGQVIPSYGPFPGGSYILKARVTNISSPTGLLVEAKVTCLP